MKQLVINVFVEDGKQRIYWYVPNTSHEGNEISTVDGLPVQFEFDQNNQLVVTDKEE